MVLKADLSSISLWDICKNVCARLRWLQSPKSRRSAISGLCSERAQHDRPETRYTPWSCHALLQICPAVSSITSEGKPSTSVLQFREKKNCPMLGFEPTTIGLRDRCFATGLWRFLKVSRPHLTHETRKISDFDENQMKMSIPAVLRYHNTGQW